MEVGIKSSLMGTEFQIYLVKRVLEMDGGDGCPNKVYILNATELYT